MAGRVAVRAVLLLVLLGAGATVVLTPPVPAVGAPAEPPDSNAAGAFRDHGPITVVTTQGQTTGGRIVAVDRSGTVRYRFRNYTSFHDVDPSPEGRWTVTFVAATLRLGRGPCETTRCARNDIVRVNLTTGERTVLYSTWLPTWHKWHDVDRIAPGRFLVADIAADRVLVVDVSAYDPDRGPRRLRDDVVWAWNASAAFPPGSGGPPHDWTHVNDVEALDDGRFMASLRNHDSVVFIRPGHGLQRNWTLGADDDATVLFEQHNPDYIPAACGGPAVVVADSVRARVVEYRRANGSWQLAWTWARPGLRWLRDADRLPNGHTLVTASNGDRVVEVDETGAVVWQYVVERPYEAERLGTGDESAGGPAVGGSAPSAACGSTHAPDPEPPRDDSIAEPAPTAGPLAAAAEALLPPKVLDGFLFWMPVWITVDDVLPLLVGAVAALALPAHEAYRRR